MGTCAPGPGSSAGTTLVREGVISLGTGLAVVAQAACQRARAASVEGEHAGGGQSSR